MVPCSLFTDESPGLGLTGDSKHVYIWREARNTKMIPRAIVGFSRPFRQWRCDGMGGVPIGGRTPRAHIPNLNIHALSARVGWKELPFWPQRNPRGQLVEIGMSPSH
ncbi:hypothetical protein TNCV_4162561, partial [Trichonephila clavipes]